MRVLIVKTSSMGDVIHTLPALTDAKRAIPDIVFDWVVEEGFQEIPSWHPAVERVIPIALRSWRKQLWRTWKEKHVKHFKEHLHQHHYDLVIDAQGLLKSAWVTSQVKATVAGYDKTSVREKLASRFYNKRYSVDRNMHAVERIRQLFAKALHYEEPETAGDYGLKREIFIRAGKEKPYIVFLHGTTRHDKHYPESYWRELAELLVDAGYQVRLPWGTSHDQERAERLAEGNSDIHVLPKLNLKSIAGELVNAKAVVAVDTGLGHMSAALGVPTVSLYGATKPSLIGAYGANQKHLTANECEPVNEADIDPAVFLPLKPQLVYAALQTLLNTERAAKI